MNKTINFGRHPNEKLQQLFTQKPFQIQEPEKAKIIFLGLDANWDEHIESDEYYFKEVLNYLEDGISYWKKNGFHTPMLSSSYKGKRAGKRYHQKFSKLGFTSKNAEDICFIELLSCCTFGNSSKNEKLFMEMVRANDNKKHLERIRNLSKKDNILICIPGSKDFKRIIDELKLFDTNDKTKIKEHTHFSFPFITNNALKKLGEELHEFLKRD